MPTKTTKTRIESKQTDCQITFTICSTLQSEGTFHVNERSRL